MWLQQSHPAKLLPHQIGQGAGGEWTAAQGFTGTLYTLSAWWEHTQSLSQTNIDIQTGDFINVSK